MFCGTDTASRHTGAYRTDCILYVVINLYVCPVYPVYFVSYSSTTTQKDKIKKPQPDLHLSFLKKLNMYLLSISKKLRIHFSIHET